MIMPMLPPCPTLPPMLPLCPALPPMTPLYLYYHLW